MLRDNYTCQRCGKYQETGLHGSHVYGRGAQRDPYMKWDVQNVKAMCYPCHQWFAECPVESGAWFKAKFPERVEYLEKLMLDRKGTGTVHLIELEDIEQKLKETLKGMK